VLVDDDTREATVIVPEDQLALAIGKEGLNARLATRLTGWKIDITSDVEFAQQEAQAAFGGGERGEEEFSGRCAAILTNGKRCPNASLPGTRFCGIPAHQELASKSPEELIGQVVQIGGPPVEADDSAEEEITEAGIPQPEPVGATGLAVAQPEVAEPPPLRPDEDAASE
jgi:N utilization substance protein A